MDHNIVSMRLDRVLRDKLIGLVSLIRGDRLGAGEAEVVLPELITWSPSRSDVRDPKNRTA